MSISHQIETSAAEAANAAITEVQPSSFIECGGCGNEPPDQEAPPRHPCPKCREQDWRRVYRPAPAPSPTASLGRCQTFAEWRGLRTGPVVRTATRVYLPGAPRPRPQRYARNSVLV
jgi:hypothetical protein